MWGIGGGPGGFTGWDYDVAPRCLDEAVTLGCTFFDTAWVYGRGISEQLLGALLRAIPTGGCTSPRRSRRRTANGRRARTTRSTTSTPPTTSASTPTRAWRTSEWRASTCCSSTSGRTGWAGDERWQQAVADLKREGLIDAVGISVNRWEPANCLAALDTGLIDVIQVIYNIFDQAPEDELFDRAQRDGIGIIARVPVRRGHSHRHADRRQHLAGGGLAQHLLLRRRTSRPSVERAERLTAAVPDGHDAARTGPAVHPRTIRRSPR